MLPPGIWSRRTVLAPRIYWGGYSNSRRSVNVDDSAISEWAMLSLSTGPSPYIVKSSLLMADPHLNLSCVATIYRLD